MKTEEQIKEIADKYAKTETIPSAGLILTARNAFLDGAHFGRGLGKIEAFEWKDVNDGLPKDLPIPLLIKQANGRMHVGRMSSHYFIDNMNRTIGGVTHYRYINREDMP